MIKNWFYFQRVTCGMSTALASPAPESPKAPLKAEREEEEGDGAQDNSSDPATAENPSKEIL